MRCARARLRAARRHGRLGALPLRHARARGRLLRRAARHRARRPVARIRSPQWLDPLRRDDARRRHRLRHAARAGASAAGAIARRDDAARGALVLSLDVAVARRLVFAAAARSSRRAPTIRSSTSASDGRARDPLALPPVPPPAPANHPRRDRVLAALFVAFIALPGAAAALALGVRPLMARCVAADAVENRRAAPWPALAVDAGVYARVRRARSPIASAAATRSCALHHALARRWDSACRRRRTVMLGRDGWLYFARRGRTRARPPLSRHAARDRRRGRRASAAELERRADWLARARHRLRRDDRAGQVHDLSRAPADVGTRRRASAHAARPPRRGAARERRPLRFVDLRGPLRAAKAREPALLPDGFALEPTRARSSATTR